MYTNEVETIARIERLELEVRDIRRKIEHVRAEADKRCLNKQINELREESKHLRGRLRW